MTADLNLRRIRLRTTAEPTFVVTVYPTRQELLLPANSTGFDCRVKFAVECRSPERNRRKSLRPGSRVTLQSLISVSQFLPLKTGSPVAGAVRQRGVCGLLRDAWLLPCGHLWLPCGHENRGGVCGQGYWVETYASSSKHPPVDWWTLMFKFVSGPNCEYPQQTVPFRFTVSRKRHAIRQPKFPAGYMGPEWPSQQKQPGFSI